MTSISAISKLVKDVGALLRVIEMVEAHARHSLKPELLGGFA